MSLRDLSWKPTLFFAVAGVACIAWPVYAYRVGWHPLEAWLALGYLFANGIAVTVGYHRLLAHQSFECPAAVKAVLLIVAASACSGSAFRWASDHVQHHTYVDGALDPYTPKRGFWNAQLGWVFRREVPMLPAPAFLVRDRLVAWQHRHFALLSIGTGLVLPYLVAGVGGLLLAGFVRVFVFLQLEGFINSFSHMGKNRRYDPDQSASENGFVALLTFGEGWHSYHHRYPYDYRLGPSPLQYDPGKWLIALLARVGLASQLRRARAADRHEPRELSGETRADVVV